MKTIFFQKYSLYYLLVVYYPGIIMLFWTAAVVYYPGIITMFWTTAVVY